jgi:CheY-like chemotaxis protein
MALAPCIGVDPGRGRGRYDTPKGARDSSPRHESGTVTRAWRVLIVDDDPDGREIAARFLGFAGFDVSEAENGRDAIAGALTRKPDLILMDLEMPVMGGLEAIRRLKLDARTRAIPIVVLSANSAGDRAEAQRAGCAATLFKPCDPSSLERTLRELLEERARRSGTSGRP